MAKKLYLVDERTYRNLKTPWQNAVVDKFQEASWSKPPEKRSKNEMYRDMCRLLDNDDMNDDEKAKLYNQRFIRYQNTNKGAEMQPVVVKQEPVHEIAAQPKTSAKRTKRKRKVSKAKPRATQWEACLLEKMTKMASGKQLRIKRRRRLCRRQYVARRDRKRL